MKRLDLMLFGAAVVGLALAEVSCGTSAPKCGPATCRGCCSTDGACILGQSSRSCGFGGAACASCSETESCQLGYCTPTSGTGGGAGGGGGSGGGGGGGGTGGGGDSGDGGTTATSISMAKQARFGDHVLLSNVVVVAIDSLRPAGPSSSCASLNPPGWYADFWVEEPQNPGVGIWVSKYCSDLPTDYQPHIGDLLNIDGYFSRASKYDDRTGYRLEVVNQFQFATSNSAPLVLTKVGSQSPPSDFLAPTGFGNAEGGWSLANRELVGARVHIPGPLTITDPSPTAFRRVSALPGDSVAYGFEVTGGVLINNYKTYGNSPTDGGPARCDWRKLALRGYNVTFPNGISGVYDSYTQAPCLDGGTNPDSCYGARAAGYIPGTLGALPDGGQALYTFALYPQDCETDFQGADAGI